VRSLAEKRRVRDEAARSREARASAEAALVRVVHHYGSRPEFVVLGGLVPQLLCSASDYEHAGTTDVDVQVNLEVAAGSANSGKLERALRNAEFEPDGTRAWRWTASGHTARGRKPASALLQVEATYRLGA
jgi:hypothetical protein